MSHLGSLQVECLSIVTEEHDVFLQVTQAPVLMITNSFLMEILDKTESGVEGGRGGGGGGAGVGEGGGKNTTINT